MSELGKKYEELIESDAKALKEYTLKELSVYEKEQVKRVSGIKDEPRAIAGPYSYTVHELIDQVERETKIGLDIINSMGNLKANLAKGGE
jgi:hypothetical protein